MSQFLTKEAERELVQSVATARADLAVAKEKQTKVKELLDATPEAQKYEQISAEVKAAAEIVKANEQALKAACVADYNGYDEGLTDKPTYLGGKIKLFKVWHIDEVSGIEWAFEHGHLDLINLDAKKTEKLAAAIEVPFVEKTKEPRFEINGDLSEVLPKTDV
jgi:hypothetical protein